ncbi:MAG: OmpA family protein [Xanthomonadales bacterium]|nr:OmpA family protein [Xanthomonadales bacterium]
MNKKILCGALLGALGLAQAAAANDFDDRWYVTGGVGTVSFDDLRNLDHDFSAHLGMGRFVTPNVSLDGELYYTNPEQENIDLNWSQYSLGLTGRYHFRDEGDTWWPFLSIGAGAQRHEAELPAFTDAGPVDRKGSNFYTQLGAGVQADYGRFGARAEVGYRYDFDTDAGANEDEFGDTIASVSLIVKLGDLPEPVEPTPVAPVVQEPVKTCADMDDDGDGVNNCNDKCPNSQAGQAVGADGCPVPLTIDLKGVNFDFDKDALRADAIVILDEAVSILSKYPQLRVEVAGHTDLCGPEAYNQKLSDRRAKAVYDYLTGKGIDASRLAGPNGYGESRPLEQTDQGFPGCKSETNRRTELNVQN